jgi:hypothetical protein
VTNFPSSQAVTGAVSVTNQPTNYAIETGGNLATVANAQGASGTSIPQPTGGSGVLGWLSGIYKAVTGTVAVSSTQLPAALSNGNLKTTGYDSLGNALNYNTPHDLVSTVDKAIFTGSQTLVGSAGAGSATGIIDTSNYGSFYLSVSNNGGSSGNFICAQSADGSTGWTPMSGFPSDVANNGATSNRAIASNAINSYNYNTSARYVSCYVSTSSGGAMTFTGSLNQIKFPQGTNTTTIAGGSAEGAAYTQGSSGYLVAGCVYRGNNLSSSSLTAASAVNSVATCSGSGALVVTPYAAPENTTRYNAPSGGLAAANAALAVAYGSTTSTTTTLFPIPPSGPAAAGNATLTAAITSTGQTSISVSTSTGFPASGNYIILIGSEWMLVTGGQGTTTWTVTRGVNNSAPQSSVASGTNVYYSIYRNYVDGCTIQTNSAWALSASSPLGEIAIADTVNGTSAPLWRGTLPAGANNYSVKFEPALRAAPYALVAYGVDKAGTAGSIYMNCQGHVSQ